MQARRERGPYVDDSIEQDLDLSRIRTDNCCSRIYYLTVLTNFYLCRAGNLDDSIAIKCVLRAHGERKLGTELIYDLIICID